MIRGAPIAEGAREGWERTKRELSRTRNLILIRTGEWNSSGVGVGGAGVQISVRKGREQKPSRRRQSRCRVRCQRVA